MMNFNIKEELDSLSKSLYLEAPDLWIEFLDKINSEIFDEMVIFFATKYGYLSIVSYAINNNLIDIKSQSKNNNFKNIHEHLLYIANQSSNLEIYNFLITLDNKSTQTLVTNENDEVGNEIPSYICKHCKSNIFECGYVVTENKVYRFSTKHSKPIETSNELSNCIKCCNCNSIVLGATPKKLESLCNITSCKKCSNDLREVGIIDNKKLIYNKDSNSFIYDDTYYTCDACNTPISKDQETHFSLD